MRRRRELQINTSSWIITFTDLLTLVLAFFVLRYSMTTIQAQTFNERVPENVSITPSRFDLQSLQLSTTKAEHFVPVAGLLTSTLGYPEEREDGGLSYRGTIQLYVRGQSTVIVLGSSAFTTDGDQLTFHAEEALHGLGLWLRDNSARARLSAHTGEAPPQDFSTNWELSLARSLAASRQIVDAGVEESRLEVMGYAETKPATQDGGLLKDYQNRRLEIEILPTQIASIK